MKVPTLPKTVPLPSADHASATTRSHPRKMRTASMEHWAENFHFLLHHPGGYTPESFDHYEFASPLAQSCQWHVKKFDLKNAFSQLTASGSPGYSDAYRQISLKANPQELHCRILQGPLQGLILTTTLHEHRFCLTLRTDNRKLYERLMRAKTRLSSHLEKLTNPCHLEILHVVKEL